MNGVVYKARSEVSKAIKNASAPIENVNGYGPDDKTYVFNCIYPAATQDSPEAFIVFYAVVKETKLQALR